MIAYTANYFKHEEELFNKTGYPAAVEHKKEHDELIQRVLDIKNRYQSGFSGTMSLTLMNVLHTLLITHIHGTDIADGPHLNANGIC